MSLFDPSTIDPKVRDKIIADENAKARVRKALNIVQQGVSAFMPQAFSMLKSGVTLSVDSPIRIGGAPSFELKQEANGNPYLSIDKDGDTVEDITVRVGAGSVFLSTKSKTIALDTRWLGEQNLRHVSDEALGNIAAKAIDTARALRLTTEVYAAV